MTEDVQVLVTIICDEGKIPSDTEIRRIINDISAVEGIVEVFLAPKSPEIVAIAKWEASHISTMEKIIEDIPGVQTARSEILVSPK
jgi:hypothetical protein